MKCIKITSPLNIGAEAMVYRVTDSAAHYLVTHNQHITYCPRSVWKATGRKYLDSSQIGQHVPK